MEKRLLTIEDLSEYTGVAKRTYYNWRSMGKLPIPFVKLGKRILFDKKDVDKFIQRRKVSPFDLHLQDDNSNKEQIDATETKESIVLTHVA